MEIYQECFGRTYYFRCEDQDCCSEWVLAIEQGESAGVKVVQTHEPILFDFVVSHGRCRRGLPARSEHQHGKSEWWHSFVLKVMMRCSSC